jgi:hypothetical protein
VDEQPEPQQTKMPSPQHGYVDRYCAFIDILGFRGLIGAIQGTGNR